jgi:murein DD-endopeptidase MepM/ murein hydrolase activator NlpD
VQEGEELYYNEKGHSLEGAFLKAPLDYYRISSRFTGSRYHPVLKRYRSHHGVDYAAPTGTPVYAIGSGKVIDKGFQANGGGNYVKIRHNSVYTTVYMHLHKITKGLSVGSMVRQGEQIGTVGRTGLATGPHLDFRVYMNNSPIDPLKVEAPPVEPVDNDNIQEFINYSDSIRNVLDAINIE